jgi:hypothetical protein
MRPEGARFAFAPKSLRHVRARPVLQRESMRLDHPAWLAIACLHVGVAAALVLTWGLVACTPEVPQGSPPKNGSVTTSEQRVDDAPLDETSCRDDCMQGSKAAKIQKAWERCAGACSEDDDVCLSDCDAAKEESCSGIPACDALEACFTRCKAAR